MDFTTWKWSKILLCPESRGEMGNRVLEGITNPPPCQDRRSEWTTPPAWAPRGAAGIEVGENRRKLKGGEEEPVGGSKRTELENEEQKHQSERYQWPQWEWCNGRAPRGATHCHCCHPDSQRCLSSTFHLIIQRNPAPSSAQDQLSLLSLLSLPYLSPALPALPSLHHCSRQLKGRSCHPSTWEEHQVTDKMHKHNSLLWKQLMALLKHFSQ